MRVLHVQFAGKLTSWRRRRRRVTIYVRRYPSGKLFPRWLLLFATIRNNININRPVLGSLSLSHSRTHTLSFSLYHSRFITLSHSQSESQSHSVIRRCLNVGESIDEIKLIWVTAPVVRRAGDRTTTPRWPRLHGIRTLSHKR